jgi:peptidoglycan-associated lipoprotein
MKRTNFRITLFGIGILVLFLGCAGQTSSTSVKDAYANAERIEDPLARLPVSPLSGTSAAVSPSGAASAARSHLASQADGLSPAFLFDIPFRFDRFTLLFDARAKVEVNAMRLKEQEGDRSALLLEGRCDELGSREYNLVLGERRAQTVKQYLVQLGLPSSSIDIVSYGKDQPVCLEHDEACWARNRTVHFLLK